MLSRALAGSLLFLVTLAGCAQTPTNGIEPGDGPAATEASEDPGDDASDEPTADPPSGSVKTASFKDKYTYEDGTEVEVIKIKHGKLSRADVEYADELKAGDPWTALTVRVRNGSSKTIDAYGSFSVVYGPDGEESRSMYSEGIPDSQDMTGKILPGKAKVSLETFDIPVKYQDDVVLEFNVDLEHEAAIFAGSVK